MRWRGRRGRANRLVLGVGIGYLLGTVSSADVVVKRMKGPDLRTRGTGNPGAANAMKVLGTRGGLAVMAGDIGKGVAACAVGATLAGSAGAHLAGTAAVAGHCYPVTNGFRGGKGVATSAGQCLATFPAYFPIDVGVAAAVAAVPSWKQRAFAATLTSSACWVLGGVVWWAKGWRNLWGPKPGVLLPLGALASSAMIAERFLATSGPGGPGDPSPGDSGVALSTAEAGAAGSRRAQSAPGGAHAGSVRDGGAPESPAGDVATVIEASGAAGSGGTDAGFVRDGGAPESPAGDVATVVAASRASGSDGADAASGGGAAPGSPTVDVETVTADPSTDDVS